ncbi:cytochrome P450 4C1 isoform X2 [Hydra vulgaris]|uniref:Cytochrome P450 4C1 isoform X2 n=1 Tax=Hydra vulgaris TaxID=6087 RepID=A0ABM4BR11_HYDVU
MYIIYIAVLTLLCFLLFFANILKRFYHPLCKLLSPEENFFTAHYGYFHGYDHINALINFGKQFKESGLYTLDTLNGFRFVNLLLPEFIKTVFSDGKIFQRSTALKVIIPLVGNGIIVSNYEDHHRQRKVLNEAFTLQQLKNYFPAFTVHIDLLMKLWSYTCDKENGTNIVVLDDLSNLSFDIIGDVGFGYQFNTITSHSSNEFTKALQSYCQLRFQLNAVHKALVAYFPFLMHLSFMYGKRKRAEQVIHNTIKMLINKRKKEIEDGVATDQKDFLTVVLKDQQKEGSIMTNDLIKDNLMTLLIAGHETTSIAIQWCLYMLGTNLGVQNKLREEIKKNVFDIKSISYEEVLSIKYLDCVVKETLRMHSPATFIGRISKNQTKFGDYDVPAGSFLRIPIDSAHMNESVYHDPYLFRPERFLTGEIPPLSFLTFGQGIYNCIGKNFALLEIKTFLVKALLQFEFSVDPKHLDYKKMISITIKTVEPLWIRVKPV